MKRRARPPRHLIIHLKDSQGNLVDYMTAEYQLKDILSKYDMVIKSLNEAGFTQIRGNGQLITQNSTELTTQGQTRFCGTCGEEMEFKTGISKKNGKQWKGWFCKVKEHEPIWVK